MRKVLIAALLLVSSGGAFAQRAIIAGEASPGVYENIQSTGQALHVNVVAGGSVSPAVTITQLTGNLDTTNTEILPANTSRKYLAIQNTHATSTMYLNFGAAATTAHIRVLPAQTIIFQGAVPSQSINGIADTAATTLVVLEGQ